MNKKILSLSGLLLAVILFVAFNIVMNGNVKQARVDLTENHLYTLSDGTLNILHSLKHPIALRFYYSHQAAQALPSVKAYAQRVRELLQEYQRASHGMIKLYEMNPVPFSEAEQRAKQFGLQAIPIEGEGESLYLGLAGTNRTDGVETISFFQPEKSDTLEYDLTKLVYQLSDHVRQTVGVISDLPVDGKDFDPLKGKPLGKNSSKPWPMMAQLRQMFDVTTLPKKIRLIPSSINVLMVIHPKKLSKGTLYAIDQYVLGGGKLITFVDPYAEVDQPKRDPNNPMAAVMASRSSNLPNLFKHWGVERVGMDVVADRDTAMKVSFGARSDYKPIDYVLWQSLGKAELNQKQKITRYLHQINVATVGRFKLLKDRTTKVIPLFSSSKNAMLVDKRVVQFRNDPVALLTKYVAGTLSYPYAVRIEGNVKTAFPNGYTDDMGTKEKPKNQLMQSTKPIDVIAVADVDMLNDKFWEDSEKFYGKKLSFHTSNNIDFIINAIDDMTGQDGLISVRSRAGFSRPFTRVQDIQKASEKHYRAKERALEIKLSKTKRQIARMQQERGGGGTEIMTPQQQKEIAQFNIQVDKTQQQLRKVKAKLREDIDNLELETKLFNIALMPILIVFFAIVAGWLRLRKRHKNRPKSVTE